MNSSLFFYWSKLLATFLCFQQAGANKADHLRLPTRPGPMYYPTAGEPWPTPQLSTNFDGAMIIQPQQFRFEVAGFNCPMIDDAIKRYYTYLNLPHQSAAQYEIASNKMVFESEQLLNSLEISMAHPCETMPHENMDESYEIRVNAPDTPGQAILVAPTNWGILRGLETFVQLIHLNEEKYALQIKSTLIVDYPRFPYRSVLLDTSRHYLSKKVIKENLDLMSMHKYNVFHWHIVDDQAFPYQSRAFPELSEKGAYNPYTHVYTQSDIKEIIEYARVRGIRVIPEFDTPGHSLSWGPAIPDLLTTCYDDDEPNGNYGPIDPTNPENYKFLFRLFQEVSDTFPDGFIHLGEDEVPYACWSSNPKIQQFMKGHNFTHFNKLEEHYMTTLFEHLKALPSNNTYIVWQDGVDNGVVVPKETIVHVWKRPDHFEELSKVTALGYRALLSSCWYLNYISYGIDWRKYYMCDPHDFEGTAKQKRLVMGGGPAMWGEYVDSTNLITRLWPRAAAPAERLWSNGSVKNISDASSRLEEHRCRLLNRGYSIQPPNGPGFCPGSWD